MRISLKASSMMSKDERVILFFENQGRLCLSVSGVRYVRTVQGQLRLESAS